MTSKSWV